MSDLHDIQDASATILDDENREGLIPSYITTRGELNEAEQRNILEAVEWARSRERQVLDERFLDTLHRRMFRHVWRWAGQHRRTAKNIGVDAYRIPMELRRILDDCRYWFEQETFPIDEIAARFHHRLVWVHSYPNGNGRHARLATDLLLRARGRAPFSWGQHGYADAREARGRYVAALRAADAHDFSLLLEFVRS